MLRLFRHLFLALIVLIQISAPFVHAHVLNGESKHRLHLPGLEFLERQSASGDCSASAQGVLDIVVQIQNGMVEALLAVRPAATPGPKDLHFEALPQSEWILPMPLLGSYGGIDLDLRTPFFRLALAPARAPPL
ncbi:MAG TPA: hypothetical protein VNL74_08570 [Methylococcus sp.]|nr:hypothetical protein [Methylococcus sp.]